MNPELRKTVLVLAVSASLAASLACGTSAAGEPTEPTLAPAVSPTAAEIPTKVALSVLPDEAAPFYRVMAFSLRMYERIAEDIAQYDAGEALFSPELVLFASGDAMIAREDLLASSQVPGSIRAPWEASVEAGTFLDGAVAAWSFGSIDSATTLTRIEPHLASLRAAVLDAELALQDAYGVAPSVIDAAREAAFSEADESHALQVGD